MSMYLNHRALLQCTHGGRVRLIPPPSRSLQVMGSPIVTEPDLLRAVITGCAQVGPGVKPCTRIVTVITGRAVQILTDGEIPILDSLRAVTDGGPPGIVTAVTNGESNTEPVPSSLQADVLRNAAGSGAAFCEPCRQKAAAKG